MSVKRDHFGNYDVKPSSRVSVNFPDFWGCGTVIGISCDVLTRIYIVYLDNPVEIKGQLWNAITVPCGCLTPLEE